MDNPPFGTWNLMMQAQFLQAAVQQKDEKTVADLSHFFFRKHQFPSGFTVDDYLAAAVDPAKASEKQGMARLVEADRNNLTGAIAVAVSRGHIFEAVALGIGYCSGDVEEATAFIRGSLYVHTKGLGRRRLMRLLEDTMPHAMKTIVKAASETQE